MRHRLAVHAGVAVVVAVCLAGCGISADQSPRDIIAIEQPIDLRPTRSTVVSDDPSASGPRVYFLLTEKEVVKVEPVGRKIAEDPLPLLDALMQGPAPVELEKGINTAIPTDTRVLSVDFNRGRGTLTVDLSGQFLNQNAIAVGQAVAQVVFTGTEAAGVQRVVISVEGENYDWAFDDRTFPEGTGMSRRDFPALDPTEYVEPSEPPPTRSPTEAGLSD